MSEAAVFPLRRDEIAGHSVVDLAESFGTPLYVYDAATIVERIEQLREFDVVRYAQKACSNIAILDLMRRHGVVVDAVSAGEVARALHAGFRVGCSPPEIVYTADLFDRDALEMVVRQGVHVNAGSPDMIRQLGEILDEGEITLRINPGFGHGHSRKTNTGGPQSKHGIWHEQIDDCLELASDHGLDVVGLHMHIGSGADMEHLAHVCDAMRQCAARVGGSLRTISAGGGLPTPYRDGEPRVDVGEYFRLWDAARQGLSAMLGAELTLEIEPGRFLVAESGYLLTEIRAVKQMGDNLFYLVDAGFNNLARPVMYGAYHPMSVASRALPGNGAMRNVVVGGPLCESGDIFTQEEGGVVVSRPLPPAEVGDYLVIECAGAYGHAMASNYNSKPLTAEVLLSDGKPHLIRTRQTLEDLFRHERIPA